MGLQVEPPVDRKRIKKWQAELDELFPPSDFASHLKIVWVSGDDWYVDDVWQGVERFYLFEMVPERFVDDYLINEVKHMPRPVVRYDTVMKTVSRTDCFCTRLQWDLYQETGFYPKPYWVIQGDRGGHQRWFTQLEKQWLTLQSLPIDPPLPGMLPYAPFDKRVIEKVLRHDKLRQIGNRLMAMRGSQLEQYKTLQKDLEQKFREEIVGFLKDQIGAEEGADVVKDLRARDNAPLVDTDYGRLLDTAEQNFIEHGRTA